MNKVLLTDLNDGIFTITINRPEKMNALNQAVMKELGQAVDEVYHNEDIKSVLVTGTGDKAFVAGADISEFLNLSPAEGADLSRRGQGLLRKIAHAPKAFVAAVNGFALGGGLELAMACHFRITAEHARFGLPEVSLGLIPGYGGTQRLTRLVGPGRALEMMMTGDMITADRALLMGLVNHVVPSAELIATVKTLLTRIQGRAPLAIAKLIASVNASQEQGGNGYNEEAHLFGELFKTEDLIEGAQAFLEKRKPVFRGR